ncbi:protein kinase domain-containing protein [Streptomyces sp. bgisy100]|uniref:protein kinase domain-containing protein n=1 Tax=Streptomyces sp. bgisy100 TaxID=3413783 RepID=UPI003D745606
MDALRADDPQWIGEYRLLGRLGEGGMGRVYLARSERGRTVAVKLVQSELAHQSDFRRRFAAEVEAARRVGGAWTAPVLDADTDAATPWVATGYIGGPSLHAVVADEFGPLPEHAVLTLGNGLAHALRDIHGAGLVHRDLKPSNVLITIDGPRVIDFGIARAVETVAGNGLTMTGAVVGSPGFMSPEQVRGERVTTASDLFCLGSVLAFAATGRQPFGTSNSGMHALMYRIAQEEPDLTGLPDALRELVTGCLAKDPAARVTVDQVLAHTAGGAGAEPWLPGGLLARLGREALQLLELEAERPSAPAPGPSPTPQAVVSQPLPDAVPVQNAVATPPPAVPLHATPAHSTPPPPVPPVSTPPPAHPAYGPAAAPYGPAPTPSSGPGAAPVWRSPRTLGTWLAVMLGLSTVFLLIDFKLNLAVYDAYEAYSSGTGSREAIRDGQKTVDSVGAAAAVVSLTVVVLWLVWFRRLYLNAEVFSPGSQRLSRGWTIGGWFTPIVQLWFPKQIANDIWRASVEPTVPGPYGPGTRRASLALLGWWWALFLTMYATGWMNELVAVTAENIDDYAGVTAWALLTDVVTVPAAVLALSVVLRLTSLQVKRNETRQQQGNPGFGPAYGRRY